MHPKVLQVENFGSFEKGYYEFNEGLYLIEGINDDREGSSNGSGKSIFFVDALTWVLYENTCRGIRYDDVIQKGKSHVRGRVVLEHGGREIEIVRRKERGRGSRVTVNGDSTEQHVIDKLLGVDFITFTAAIVHAQLFKGFADKTEVEQKAILTALLGLEEWDTYRKVVGEQLQKLRTDIATLRSKRDIYVEQFQAIDVTAIQHDIHTFDEQRMRKLQIIKSELHSLQNNIDKCLPEEESLRSDLNELTRKKSSIQSILDSRTSDKKQLLHESLPITTKCLQLDEKIKLLISDVENLKKLGGKCPVCKQEISDEYKSACEEHTLSEIERLKEEKVKWDKERKEIEGLAGWVDEEISRYKKLENEVTQKIYMLNAAIAKIKATYKTLCTSYSSQLALYKEIEQSPNPHILILNKKLQEKEELQNMIAELSVEIEKLEENIRYYEFWDEGFSNRGIKSYIFDLIIPEFTERANHYIQLLTNTDIQILFDTQREKKSGGIVEKFTIRISDSVGERVYGAWSGGERKRIATAIDLALSDLVMFRSKVGWDFVIFDEVFDSLDDEGKEMMVYVLEDIMRDRKRVYVISHDSTMRGMVDRRVIVTKRKGLSTINA